jgi:NhaA family Na+:H+ antiporter
VTAAPPKHPPTIDKTANRRAGPLSAFREFLSSEASAGIVLMATAGVALLVANSPAAELYFSILHVHVGSIGILHAINDGLMTVFFLLVGLEIKREFIDGQLATWRRRILPGVAAAGGMAAPAALYLAINFRLPENVPGWGVPTATDIAFALGVMALLGRRVPVSLKVFLTAIAIIDDLGAVAVIAAFYTTELSAVWLAASALALAVLVGLNRHGVERVSPYLIVGAILWFCVLNSGVHATIAGVALAMAISSRSSRCHSVRVSPPLHRLERALSKPVAFGIIPLFGFANAGVSLGDIGWTALSLPTTMGVATGLFVGKQAGVFVSTWLCVRLGLAERPEHASWPQVYGVALLCGIGFTMSLFIGLLGFAGSEQTQHEVKIGVLLGSLLSGIIGSAVLWSARKRGTP